MIARPGDGRGVPPVWARQIIAEHETRFSSRFTARELDRLTDALKRMHKRV